MICLGWLTGRLDINYLGLLGKLVDVVVMDILHSLCKFIDLLCLSL
jgi:hypothetical protein